MEIEETIMKTRRILVAILLVVIVCAVFVACNENTPQIETPNENNQGQQEPSTEETEFPIAEKKPTADPDPNNPYDIKESERDYSEEKYQYDYQEINVTLTNSESLNNLFYDYVLSDFSEDVFCDVEETTKCQTASLRRQESKGEKYDKNNNTHVNPKTFRRKFVLTLKETTRENVVKNINNLMKRKDVLYADPILKGGSWFDVPNDTNLSQQWALSKIDAYGAWSITTGSSSVTVGLIDSGIRNTHEDLFNNVTVGGYASENQNANLDTVNHGTKTAGIIGAVGNNGIGISGVCWNVNILSLKACIGANNESPQLVIKAIEYARTNDIKLLNFSGGFYDWEITETEIQELTDAIASYTGLIVVAAGNGKDEQGKSIPGTNNDVKKVYPQSLDLQNVLVVGATDSNDNIASISNYGITTVDLFAPGVSIYTTSAASNSDYGSWSGTSMAAPFVTGVAALLLSMEPNLTAAQLKARIMQNVDAVPALSNLCVSGGRLNAKKAVDAHGHDSLYTCTYTSNGVRRGHSVSCNYCDYINTEAHEWSPVKVPNTAIVKYHICIKCRAKTELVEIPNPSLLLSPSVLALINEQESVTSGDFDIEITKDVAIVKRNGKYYLMIACDDEGRRLADLSKILKR